MKKYFFAGIGALAIVVGGIDWAVGALVPHSRFLLVSGAIALVVVGILFLWQKSWQNFILPMTILAVAFLCSVDTCAMTVEQALTQPEKWPVQQWNQAAFAGADVWITILVFVVVGIVGFAVREFFRGRSERSRN